MFCTLTFLTFPTFASVATLGLSNELSHKWCICPCLSLSPIDKPRRLPSLSPTGYKEERWPALAR